jgi:hypothetical protein
VYQIIPQVMCMHGGLSTKWPPSVSNHSPGDVHARGAFAGVDSFRPTPLDPKADVCNPNPLITEILMSMSMIGDPKLT